MNLRILGVVLVLVATSIEAIGQILLKGFADAEDAAPRKNALLAGGILCMGVEAVVWSCVLRLLAVNVAYPMGSLTFVFVTIFCWLFLQEKVTRMRWIGVSCILCGTALVGLA